MTPAANPLSSLRQVACGEIYSQLKADNFNTPDFVDPETPMKPLPQLLRAYDRVRKDVQRLGQADQGRLSLSVLHFPSGPWQPLRQLEPCRQGAVSRLPLHQSSRCSEGGVGGRAIRLVSGILMADAFATRHVDGGGHARLPGPGGERWQPRSRRVGSGALIDRGGSANVLTPAVRSNYMPGLSGYNNGIVNIEKYEGEPVPPDCERDIFQIEEQ